MNMQGWVGMRPLRVQALMTKLQAQRTQIAELERQLASIQNNLNWEIASKGDINNALQRARSKIKRREELLENTERLMRESIDDFYAADKLKTEQKSALEYWSAFGKGSATAVAGLSTLAIAGKDSLWDKVGNIFQTGISGGSSYTRIPENLKIATTDSVQRKLDTEDMKNLAKKATGVFAGFNASVGKFNAKKEALWNEFSENRQQEITEARERGLQGEKPDTMLLLSNPKAFLEQKKAWKSTLSEEELAAYEARLEALEEEEEEENKSFWDKIGDTLGEAKDTVVGGFTEASEFVGDKVDDAKEAIVDGVENIKTGWNDMTEEVGGWVNDQVEDFKTNWNGMVNDVNDFLDEHPSVQYALDTAESFGKTMGDAISGSMALATGNYVKFASKVYSAWNDITDTGQNANALLSHGFGNLFEALGNEDEAQYWKEYAASEADKDGIKSELVTAFGDGAGTVIDVLDIANTTYSTVTGLTSLVEGITDADSVGEVFQSFSSWKTSDGSVISDADAFFSNAGTIFKIGEGIGEGSFSDVISSIVSPAGLGSKFGGVIDKINGVKKE